MGWGFLMGAGAGLSKGAANYATVLEQKRERDFKLKQDEVQFERQKALEDLRNNNNRALKQDEFAFREKEAGAERDWKTQQWDKETKWKEGQAIGGIDKSTGREITKAEMAKMKPEELKNIVTKDEYQMDFLSRSIGIKFDLENKQTAKQRKDMLAAAENDPLFQQLTPEEQDQIRFRTLHPEVYAIAISGQGANLTGEERAKIRGEYGKAYENAGPEWDGFTDEKRRALSKKYYSEGMIKVDDPEEAKAAYQSWRASGAIKVPGLDMGKKTNPFGSKTDAEDSGTQGGLQKLAEDLLKLPPGQQLTKIEEIRNENGEEAAQQVLAAMGKKPGPTESEVQQGPSGPKQPWLNNIGSRMERWRRKQLENQDPTVGM